MPAWWLHKDPGWWALVLTILGLILLIPANIVSNLLTPAIKNWWAERSTASTRKRIEKLEKELADYEQNYQVLSEGEEYILRGIEALGILLIFSAEAIAVLLLAVVEFLAAKVNSPDSKPIQLFAILIAVAGYIGFFVFGKSARFRRERSPSNRRFVRQNIDRLKERLAERRQ